jgi:hypothetical protein
MAEVGRRVEAGISKASRRGKALAEGFTREVRPGRDSAARRDPSIFLRPDGTLRAVHDILTAMPRLRDWDSEYMPRCVAVAQQRGTAISPAMYAPAAAATPPAGGVCTNGGGLSGMRSAPVNK